MINRRKLLTRIGAAYLMAGGWGAGAAGGAAPREGTGKPMERPDGAFGLGSRRELFVDHTLIAALQERIRRAEQAVEREKEQAKQTGLQTALSVGATILGAFMGRKTISATTIGKASTALGKAGRTMKDMKDVGMAQDNVAALQQQLADLEAQFKSETGHLSAVDPQSEPLETLALRPTKTNIAVKLVALAWLPHWQDAQGALTPAWE